MIEDDCSTQACRPESPAPLASAVPTARFSVTRVSRFLSARIVWKLDPYLLRMTRGRIGMGLVLPTALLETHGAKTGLRRRNAVIYFHDGDRVTIVASFASTPKHPAWFHNLLAHPDVTFGGISMRATVVDDENRASTTLDPRRPRVCTVRDLPPRRSEVRPADPDRSAHRAHGAIGGPPPSSCGICCDATTSIWQPHDCAPVARRGGTSRSDECGRSRWRAPSSARGDSVRLATRARARPAFVLARMCLDVGTSMAPITPGR